MSYYILPKNVILPNISVQYCDDFSREDDPPSIYISQSLVNYYYQLKSQIDDFFVDNVDLSDNSFDAATRVINPYEFIFSKVPGSKYSVSKLKPHSNLFYDLLEISSTLGIFEVFDTSQQLQCLHISTNMEDSVECFDMIRNDVHDIHITKPTVVLDDIENYTRVHDVIFFEPDMSEPLMVNYFRSLQTCLGVILKAQAYNGIAIIKVHESFYKPAIDFIYILTGLYEKVYITKPSTSNVTTFEKYIVCKHFRYDDRNHDKSNSTYILDVKCMSLFYNKSRAQYIQGFGNNQFPCYFMNKVDDINMIMGQQQLDALDQIVSIYKNKNKLDKIESIKKNNIQKSVLWCEKYKIPCNKFTEKINIFLPIINGPLSRVGDLTSACSSDITIR
ncbi:MAG: hypothetical protein ACOVRN_19930 [Flavobacterium sp.]